MAIFLFIKLISKITKDADDTLEINTKSIIPKRSSPAFYFLAYVLPLILGDEINFPEFSLIFLLVVVLCFYSESEESNPIIKLSGYKFYEVTDNMNLTYLIMSKAEITDFIDTQFQLKKIKVVTMNSNLYIHVV